MNFFIIYLKYISDHTNNANARPKQSTQIMIQCQCHLFNPKMDIKYSKCKRVHASGGKSIGIYNSQTGQPLYVETPILMTWGLQQYTDDNTGKVSYELSLQFPTDDFSNKETRGFLQSMIAFERKLKADALTNSKEWFEKSNMTPDAVEAMFTPILKYPKDKVTCEKDLSKKPTMRIKVPFLQGKWEGVEIYDADRNCLFPSSDPNVSPIDIITKSSQMKMMIQCGGIWFANGKFGITWRFIEGEMYRVHRRRDYHIYNIAIAEAFAAKAEAFASMAEAIKKRRPACEWFERISVVAGQATTEASTHYPKMMRP